MISTSRIPVSIGGRIFNPAFSVLLDTLNLKETPGVSGSGPAVSRSLNGAEEQDQPSGRIPNLSRRQAGANPGGTETGVSARKAAIWPKRVCSAGQR